MPLPKRISAAWLVLLGVFLLSSCSTTGKLELVPATALPVVQPSLQAQPNTSDVSLARPQDLRADKTMGRLSGGSFGLNRITILPAGDPALWVGNAIAAGLENNGYHVAKVEALKDALTPLAIEVVLTTLVTSVETGFFTVTGKNVVVAKVSIYSSGQLLQQREYTGTASESSAQLRAHHLQSAVNLSLEDLLNKAIPDICAALAKARQTVAEQALAPAVLK